MLYAILVIIALIIIVKMLKTDTKKKSTEVDYFHTETQKANLNSLINDTVVKKKHFDPIKDSPFYVPQKEEKRPYFSLEKRVALAKEQNGPSQDQEPKRNFVKSVDFNNNQFKSPTRNVNFVPKKKENLDLPNNYYEADMDLQLQWDSGYFNDFPDPYTEFYRRFIDQDFEKRQELHEERKEERDFLRELELEEQREESRILHARNGNNDDIF